LSQPFYPCPRCGSPLQIGQEVCKQCGLPLDPTSLAAYAAPGATPAPPAGALGPPALPGPGVRRRTRLGPWLIGSAIALALCCAGTGVFLVTNGVQFFQGLAQESAATTALVDRFMRAGVANDPGTAWALFSPTATTATRSSIAALFSSRRDYFDGYTATQIANFRENSGTSGTTAYADGQISYTSRPAVEFTAQFVKEHNQWKLTRIQLAEGVGQ
jgi:hypothetical protein